MLTSSVLSFNFLPKPVRMGKMKKKGLWSGRSFWGNDSGMFSPWKGLTGTGACSGRCAGGKAQISGVRDEVFESRFSCRDERETASPYSFQGPNLVLLHIRHTEFFFFFWLKYRF